MAYGKPIKKNFYRDGVGAGEIAMPAEGEIPPVLADSPQDWAGNNQPQEVAPETDVVETIQEQENESNDDTVSSDIQEVDDTSVQEEKQRSKSASENLRILREAREKAERERDELMKYVLDMKKSEQKPQPIQEIEEDLDISVDDDALLEGKHAKKLLKKIAMMEKKLESYQSVSSENAIETKIKNQYPDFDVVVNKENIAQLNEEYPEIAATLRDTKDLYSKATAAYKIMKKFGIYQDKRYEQDKVTALKNSSKPRPLSSISPQQGESPLSKANAFANGMTKDLQAQLLKEMAQARKNL